MDFSLRVNRKQIATNSSPYRDQQFQHICALRTRFERQGLPIISVDTKKREMIGNFKNAGTKWGRSPVLVNDHDFLTDVSGVGISYGIYDRPTTAAPSASAPPTTRRPSPPTPSPLGGIAKEPVTAVRPGFCSWPTPAAATGALPGH
jgi:Rhodopirellula transposase DDE domain